MPVKNNQNVCRRKKRTEERRGISTVVHAPSIPKSCMNGTSRCVDPASRIVNPSFRTARGASLTACRPLALANTKLQDVPPAMEPAMREIIWVGFFLVADVDAAKGTIEAAAVVELDMVGEELRACLGT